MSWLALRLLMVAGTAVPCAAAPDGAGWPSPLVVLDSVYVADGALMVDFHADSVVTAKLLESLRRGFTAAISYQVQVWHKRWASDLLAERRLGWKAAFDNWEQKYVVIGGGERRATASAATVRTKWTVHQGLRLVEVGQLQPGRNYYLTIEAFFEPVSKENLREIRGWLSGEIAAAREDAPADTQAATSGLKMRLLGTLMNLIGFGGRKATTRSGLFQVLEHTILWQP